MRWVRVLFVVPLWLLITAENPSPSPPPSENPSPAPSPSPSPLPTPVNAFLSLSVTAGPATTVIEVTGGQFLPNQQMNLYWDTPNKVAGSATADANGSFNTRVKPNANDKPGVHRLFANVAPFPYANFLLQSATPTPSPSPTPEESPSPSPEISPTPAPTLIATAARTNSTISGFDVITRPPFVFLPIFGAGALLLSLAYWAFTAMRRPRNLAPAPAAAVVHRATRPDYTASFGAPPPRPAAPMQQSAWEESMPATPPLPPTPRNIIRTPTPIAPPPQPQTQAEYHAWGLGEPDAGYPDLGEPKSNMPEPPQPSDK
jgi:hypothetical protein